MKKEEGEQKWLITKRKGWIFKIKEKYMLSQGWWHISAVQRWESGSRGSGVQGQPQLHDEFQVSLGYMTACLKQARITMPLIANF